jgi:hypothetical protein
MASELINIFAKSLSGDLYQIYVYQDSSPSDIAQVLYSSYPEVFGDGDDETNETNKNGQDINIVFNESSCKLVDGDVVNVFLVPQKIVAAKKMFTRDNSISMYIGVKLFDCIQNVRLYDDGEEVYDIDLEELQKTYETYYPGTSIRGPEKLGVDSNRLNITKKSRTSNEYRCSMGNFGNEIRGNDLRQMLSSTFTQSICYISSNAKPGIPHYSMRFQFKPRAIDFIVKIFQKYVK